MKRSKRREGWDKSRSILHERVKMKYSQYVSEVETTKGILGFHQTLRRELYPAFLSSGTLCRVCVSIGKGRYRPGGRWVAVFQKRRLSSGRKTIDHRITKTGVPTYSPQHLTATGVTLRSCRSPGRFGLRPNARDQVEDVGM